MCDNPRICPDGNCVGCRNGEVWCQDPRCEGQCPDCFYDPRDDRVGYTVFIIIIAVLVVVMVIVMLNYGHTMTYYYVPNYQLQEKGYQINNGPEINF